jgi:hypothetical protein
MSVYPHVSGEPILDSICRLQEPAVKAIIRSRYVCWTGVPLSKGLFKIFQKAPAPTGAFWFLLFVHLTEFLPIFRTIQCRGFASALRADTQVAGTLSPQTSLRNEKHGSLSR